MSESSDSKDVLKSVAQSTSYTIALQLIFRVVTFIVNLVIIRFVSTELLGVANVRLMVLHMTIDFLSKEPFVKSCLSKTSSQSEKWREIINISWLSPLISILLSIIFSYIWNNLLESPDPQSVPYYNIGVYVYCITAIIRSLSLPYYVISQKLLYVRYKAIQDGISLGLKFIVLLLLVITYPDLGLINFCISEVVYAVSHTAGYIIYLSSQTKFYKKSDFPFNKPTDFLPSVLPGQTIFDGELLILTWSFVKQSFLKQFLTEGEKYMMTMFDIISFSDQGVFDIVSNLGALVARFFFLPLEESSYLLFSQTIVRGIPAKEQNKEEINRATQVFINIIKLVSVASLIILSFGFSFSHLALFLYGGSKLSSGAAPVLLRWYCVYVLTLAVNGITECFSFATMSQIQIDTYNYKMLFFSLLFLISSYLLTGWFGSVGFILANCWNMSSRIVHSSYQINRFYRETQYKPLTNSLLNYKLYFIFLSVSVLLAISEIYIGIDTLLHSIEHVSVGIVCLLLVLMAVYNYERDCSLYIYKHFVSPLIKRKTG